jgi:hypothetical protein
MKTYFLWFSATVLCLASTHSIQAQIITNAEIERGLRYRGTTSYDGEPYTARYSYGLGAAPIYLNGNSRQLYYLDYLDRADRAAKFGYPMPVDPFFGPPPMPMPMPPPPPAEPTVRAGVGAGFGFGVWRRR